jgi:hypothetical protein
MPDQQQDQCPTEQPGGHVLDIALERIAREGLAQDPSGPVGRFGSAW